MKKSMLLLLIAITVAAGSFANSMRVRNNTPCSYYISTQGGSFWVTPAGTMGSVVFFATGNFFAAKVLRDNIPAYQINVGTNPPAPANQNVLVYSSSVNDYPPCNNGNMYRVTWETNGASDVQLTID
ncbi:hypothetical protein [Taibaiella chishuiensis]|uniref:Uncharacterized protein n=1 Tax=Taibaiella chishuiensis TaxID=1434707 RepID=A0A2P8D0P5_9BACT|nr:hypothetical protein [Taibaiella chishuiensis]PSK90736.1 hypothetical protein B0I18_107146 [Taibaiella chishuiensis]